MSKFIKPQQPKLPPPSPHKVYVGMPSYGNQINGGLFIKYNKMTDPLRRMQTFSQRFDFSGPTHAMNNLWVSALNARKILGVTHFLMWHSDIVPEDFFLDKMVDLMSMHKCGVLSCLAPLKNPTGMTSTALDESLEGSDPYWRPRRLTMHEMFERPGTWTAPNLLINTGLMLVDLRQPFVEKCWFYYDDVIGFDQDGKFVAQFAPEDWNFARLVNKNGGSCWVTREVRLEHHGGASFGNWQPFGSIKTDKIMPHENCVMLNRPKDENPKNE